MHAEFSSIMILIKLNPKQSMPSFNKYLFVSTVVLFLYFLTFGVQNTTAQTIVKDSSLELGSNNPYWIQQSTNFSKTICDGSCGNVPGVEAYSGSYFIWLGGSNLLEEGSASQMVIIPNANYAKLSFYLKTPFVAANIDDYFRVFMDSITLFNINSSDSTTYKSEYQHIEVDISSYADGQQHKLMFFGHQTGSPKVTSYLVDDITIKIVVGISEPISLKNIKIYPNPASDYIHLELSKHQDINIEVTTIAGKIVLQKKFTNAYSINMKISELPKGLYFLVIENKNKEKIIKKLIVT